MNPISNLLNSGSPVQQPPVINNINQIKSLMNTVQSAKNPISMMQNIINSNPQVKQVMDIVQKYNGDAKSAFYNLAKEKGVNPDDIIKALNS